MGKTPSKKPPSSSRPSGRQRMLFDAATGAAINPKTGRPVSSAATSRHAATESAARAKRAATERRERRMKEQARRDQAAAARRMWVERRPEGMRATEYALPADVVKVLLDLQTYEWERDIVLMSFCECSRAAMKQEVVEAARKAFIEGATQGFIEGFVARLERDRIVSRKRNQRKREKNDMDARDAAIVAEFPILRGMLGSTEAQYRLCLLYTSPSPRD